jgi:hypothetical protein
MYVALFFGVVHANMWGFDFENGFIVVIYDGLFVLALAGLVLKRWQFHRIKQKRNHMTNHPTNNLVSKP